MSLYDWLTWYEPQNRTLAAEVLCRQLARLVSRALRAVFSPCPRSVSQYVLHLHTEPLQARHCGVLLMGQITTAVLVRPHNINTVRVAIDHTHHGKERTQCVDEIEELECCQVCVAFALHGKVSGISLWCL